MSRERITGLPRPARNGEPVAIDLEVFKQDGSRLHRPGGLFACLTFSFEDATYMITDSHDVPDALERISEGMWVFQNAVYDLRQLRRWAEIKPREIWDTMLIEQDLFGGLYDSFGLDALTRRWLGRRLPKDQREEFGGRESMTPEMIEYSFTDPEVTFDIMKKQARYIDLHKEEMRHYWEIDEPVIWAVLDMPPPRVDAEAWIQSSKEFAIEAKKAEEAIGINSKSWQQSQQWLAEVTGDPRWVDPGRSTNQDNLNSLVEDGYTKVEKLIYARKMRDMSGARYGEGWIDKYVEEGGLVYSDWKISRAATGRAASASPNLQNIPVREFPLFRSFFIPRPGNLIGVWDVSQQEPRVLAHYSQDEALLEAIRSGEDLHQYVADQISEVLGRSVDRSVGKTVNLGTSYGLTEFGLAGRLGLELEEAESLINAYFRRFHGVESWINKQRRSALSLGYIRTVAGRRCWVNPYQYKVRNTAINYPIQGSAADHTKLALNYNKRISEDRDLPFAVTMMVHDEHVMDFPAELKDEYGKLADDAWTLAWKDLIQDVPVKIDGKVGSSWAVKEEKED